MQIQPAVNAPQRMEDLDALRGLASVVVMASHFAGIFFPGLVFGREWHFAWERLFVTTPLHVLVSGHFAVCLFFVLSGFVLSLNALAPGKKASVVGLACSVLRRPVRLIGVVLVTTLAALACWSNGWFFNQQAAAIMGNSWLAWFWPVPPEPGAITAVLRSPFFAGAWLNPPLWTIALELYGSWMLFFLLAGITRLLKWRITALVMAAVALSWLPKFLVFCGYDSVFVGVESWRLLQGFVWGMIIAQMWHAPPSWGTLLWRRWYVRFLWIALALVFASVPQYAAIRGSVHAHLPPLTPNLGGGYPMMGAVMLFVAVLAGSGRWILRSRPARFLGGVSYALYGCHFIIQASLCCWVYVVLTERGWEHPPASLVSLLIMLVTVLTCAWCLSRWVDRPSMRLATLVGKLTERVFERKAGT